MEDDEEVDYGSDSLGDLSDTSVLDTLSRSHEASESTGSSASVMHEEAMEPDSDSELDSGPIQDEEVGLVAGGYAEHELLRRVRVLQLVGHEPWQARKTFVELLKTGSKSRKGACNKRWVFTDCLTPIPPSLSEGAATSSTSRFLPRTSADCADAFDAMQQARKDADAQLDSLGVPQTAELARMERKRKMRELRATVKRGRRPKMGERVTKEPKGDGYAQKRVDEFPGESLIVSNGKLFCQGCTSEVSMRKCVLVQHILKSKSHRKKVEAWNAKLEHQKKTIEVCAYHSSRTPGTHHITLAPPFCVCQMLERERERSPDLQGGCVRKEVQEYRFAVVRTLMGCGIPLNKLDTGLSALLSRSGHTTSSIADMRQYVPLVQAAEVDELWSEIEDQWLSIIFDGTTRVGEIVALLARYCTEDFYLKHKLLGVKTAKRHMNGVELSGTLIRLMTQRAGPNSLDRTLADARDSCSTNGVAVRCLQNSCLPKLLDMKCISHTLNNCAKHMDFEVLDEWLTPWLRLMSHSHQAKQLWAELIGRTPKLFSKVRWWSRWECASELATCFAFLRRLLDMLQQHQVGEATTEALVEFWNDVTKRDQLELELAVVMDASIFCEKTYRLEGDRLEILFVYEDIEAIRVMGRMLAAGDDATTMPNVAALLRRRTKVQLNTPVYEWFGPPHSAYFKGKVSKLPTAAAPEAYTVRYTDGGTLRVDVNELTSSIDVRELPEWQKSREHLLGAFTYLEDRLRDNCDAPYALAGMYDVCYVVRAFDPTWVTTGGELDSAFIADRLSVLPWLDVMTLRSLAKELPDYLVACSAFNDVSRRSISDFTDAVLGFWRTVTHLCKTWRFEARRAFCLTPNSASSERVFARLKLMFGEMQTNSLSDYVEGALMLAQNERVLG